jgi:sn-glycerol 3-phosphate transport system ATP-binding protein
MPGLKTIPAGQSLDIGFADEHLHFFDASGRRTETRPPRPAE